MGTQLVDHLTPEEREQLSRLNPEIADLKEMLIACRANRVDTETRKEELETNLSTNLVKRKQELEVVKLSPETESLNAEGEAKSQELQDTKLHVEEVNISVTPVRLVRLTLVDIIMTETRKAELETNLSTNLVRRKQELEAVKQSPETESLNAEAEVKRQELQDAKARLDEYEKSRQNEDKRAEQLISRKNILLAKQEEYSKKIRELGPLSSDAFEMHKRKSIKELYKMLHKCNEQLKQFSHVNKKALDQYANFTDQREELQKRQQELDAGDEQEEYSKKIRELGPLSSDAFEIHKRKIIKELYKMLQKCNEQLKQFSQVNKKALDQYANFTDQREELQKRQQELDAGDEKIKELVSVLDQRKDESIEHTFKGVAKHFRDVFSDLVQGGHGFLIMMKKNDGDPADNDYDEDGPRLPDTEGRVEKYVGVKVKVSFTGQGETQSMKQLSGDQKTVVALALIFSIQRCDPTPFYLFDEIDTALKPQYRTIVGSMVRGLANMTSTQFITTTFRPELVKVADKIYGVTHKNCVSHVNVVTMEEALDFIEHDQSYNAE
ncbi:structural maintenance of chromosomes protein 3 [Tanacetum coccineum]